MSLWEKIDEQNCRNGVNIDASIFLFFFFSFSSIMKSQSYYLFIFDFLSVSFSLNMICLKFKTCFGVFLAFTFY